MDTWNGFRGAAKRLEDRDLPRIGASIGVGEDEIHAFMDVEASGSGFDAQGRPKMLFEPHVFWRNLPADKRAIAQAAGLAYPKWRPGAYPKDSYPRLAQAMEIDETAALKAASWGLGQILGENHRMAGYETPREMVRAFIDGGEAEHLEAMVRFLVAAGLDDDLRAHRWEALARGYNGPGYAAHGYHTRLAKAYARWAGIRDTPWQPGAVAADEEIGTKPLPGKASEAVTSTKEINSPATTGPLAKWEIEGLQKRLRELGYFEVGKVDGIWGGRTAGALSAFQHDNGLKVDGRYGMQTKAALQTARPRQVSPVRAAATIDDVRRQGSSTIARADGITWGSNLLTLGGVLVAILTFVAQNWAQAEALAATFRPLLGWLPAWAYPLPVIAAGLYLYAQGQAVKIARVQAERSGMHNGEPDPAPSPPVEHAPEPVQGLAAVIAAGLPFGMPRPPRR